MEAPGTDGSEAQSMRMGWLLAAYCLTIAWAAGAHAQAEPLQFRWPLPAEARVTQATVDHFGNFALEYRIRADRMAAGGPIRVSAAGYRLLYHNRNLLTGRKLDRFDMLGILHRLTVPSYVVDAQGGLLRIEPPEPQEIETAFLQNVGSKRAASLRQWFVQRRPGDFREVRERSVQYWQAQTPFWEYWAGRWGSLYGPAAPGPGGKQMLHLAGLRLPGRTHLSERLPAPDCASCVAVAVEDRFSREDLASHLDAVAGRLGLTRRPEEAAMTSMHAFVRLEAIIDWQTMLPYRVHTMTIAFQDLADGKAVAFDQAKDFYFEWQNLPAGRGTE